MPPKTTRVPRRKMKGRLRKARSKRGTGNQPEWATMSETKEFLPATGLSIGTIYNFSDVQLAQFTRAATVAEGYQEFRITKLTYVIQPLLDTFSSAGATQVPYLYWVINRTGQNYAGLNKAWFLANGAKPVRFDDKNITISYAPSVILDATEAAAPGVGNQANLAKRKQWLSCNKEAFTGNPYAPSQTSHCGHFQYILSEGSAQEMTYRMTVTAEFQFRKPAAPNLGSDVLPTVRL